MNSKSNKQNNAISDKRIVLVGCFLLVLFAFYKTTIGFHSDEAHFIAVGDMLSRGNSLFKEIWYYQQMSGVFVAPIIYVYRCIVGSNEGVLLFFRILSVAVQLLICFYFYRTFSEKYSKKSVLSAVLLLFCYVPDFQSFNYKQEYIWLLTLIIIYLYKYNLSHHIKYSVYLGIVLSICVLVYPTAIILFPVLLMLLFKLSDRTQAYKTCGGLLLCCVICAGLFFVFVFSKISIKEFITYFPKVFMDDNLDSNFITKLGHPLVKFIIFAIMAWGPIAVVSHENFVSRIFIKYKVPVIGCQLVGIFLLQCFVERAGISWHCITYPYLMAAFVLWALVLFNMCDDKTDIRIFLIPSFISALAMAIASNQGNITALYPMVLPAMGLIMIYDEKHIKNSMVLGTGKLIRVILVISALLMYILPVWEQEACLGPEYGARTIFTDREINESGCLKGISMGAEYYNKYVILRDTVQNSVSKTDKTLLIDDYDICAMGYLDMQGDMATFSPQGGMGIEKGDKIVEYLSDNVRLTPTKIILNMNYIGGEYSDYVTVTPLGKYILDNEYEIIDTNEYYVVLGKKNN